MIVVCMPAAFKAQHNNARPVPKVVSRQIETVRSKAIFHLAVRAFFTKLDKSSTNEQGSIRAKASAGFVAPMRQSKQAGENHVVK